MASNLSMYFLPRSMACVVCISRVSICRTFKSTLRISVCTHSFTSSSAEFAKSVRRVRTSDNSACASLSAVAAESAAAATACLSGVSLRYSLVRCSDLPASSALAREGSASLKVSTTFWMSASMTFFFASIARRFCSASLRRAAEASSSRAMPTPTFTRWKDARGTPFPSPCFFTMMPAASLVREKRNSLLAYAMISSTDITPLLVTLYLSKTEVRFSKTFMA
mmetsp:Transcript_41257/g.76757  ORF Transcript_41257/g.76757 Transcript_41257/m.76757 type:complete len:223 (-) Transcript_41257:1362-2030(-)